MKVFSYGGGADSYAMELDAFDRGELPDLALFADVGSKKGNDGEWPDTYRHMLEYAIPQFEARGVPFVWIGTDMYPIRGRESLMRYFEETRTLPTRMSRMCTMASKVERINKYIADHHAGEPIEMWIGFEAGEEKRLENDPHANGATPGRVNRYPLAERGLCRCLAVKLIRDHGMPVPRKSACMFCPFSTRGDFQTLARDYPETFNRVATMEENCHTTKSGKVMKYSFDGPHLREWIKKPYKKRVIPCKVCGASERETKETGCGWL